MDGARGVAVTLLALLVACQTAGVTLTATLVPTCVREGEACVLYHPGDGATCEVEGDGCRLVVPDPALPGDVEVPPTTEPVEGPP